MIGKSSSAFVLAFLAVGSLANLAEAGASTTVTLQAGSIFRTTPGVGSTTSAASDNASQNGASVQANALSGRGSLSTFASGVGTTTFSGFVTAGARAIASFSDVVTFNADGGIQDPLVFRFLINATGSVSASAPPNRVVSARSEYAISLTDASGSGSITGGRQAGVRNVVLPGGGLGLESFDEQIGQGFGAVPVEVVYSRQFAGMTGMPVSIGFSSESRVSFSAGGGFNNGTFSALADFGSTLRWVGLESVRFLDGTPYTGGFSITSESGFDYTTPAPGAATSLVMLGVVAGMRRRL